MGLILIEPKLHSLVKYPAYLRNRFTKNTQAKLNRKRRKEMINVNAAKKFADLLEAKDLNGIQEILAEDFVAKGPTMELNKQQAINYLQALFTAFPNFSFGLTDIEETEGQIRFTSYQKGTHQGVLDLNSFGIPISSPPTGKTFNLPKEKILLRMADDKITYFTEEIAEGGGLAGILAQLGIVSP